jgi:hypothetical protein
MKRTFTLCLVLAAIAGCGSDGAERPTPAVDREPDGPQIVLISTAGRQLADPSSSCITDLKDAGGASTICADYAYSPPSRYSVVRPSEEVEIAVLGATVTAGATVISKIRCGQQVPGDQIASIPLPRGRTSWTVDLEPGLYEARVGIDQFSDGKGRSGSTSGTLGLMVNTTRDPAVLDGCR